MFEGQLEKTRLRHSQALTRVHAVINLLQKLEVGQLVAQLEADVEAFGALLSSAKAALTARAQVEVCNVLGVQYGSCSDSWTSSLLPCQPVLTVQQLLCRSIDS